MPGVSWNFLPPRFLAGTSALRPGVGRRGGARRRGTTAWGAAGLGRGWAAALLALALLGTQWLGVVHRVAHGIPIPSARGESPHPATVEHAGATATPSPHAAADGWLARLFSCHGHADLCALYDQLSHADGLTAPTSVWLVASALAVRGVWHRCGRCAAPALGFLARGPPDGR
jgi:hypothetical protein